MSGKIVGEVLDYAPEDLTETQFRVLICLAESAREDRVSRTNTREVARRARRAEGSVRRALADLASRCLIRPVHPRSKIGRGRIAQQYAIAQLEAHHRATTMHRSAPPEAPNSVTSSGDANEPNSVTPECDTEPCGKLGPAERIASHGEPNSVTPGCDTTRKDLPVTTVSSNSSRQVTVQPDTDESGPCETNGAPNSTVANGLPPSLRSVGLDQHPAEPSQWSRAGPPSEPPSPATRIPA